MFEIGTRGADASSISGVSTAVHGLVFASTVVCIEQQMNDGGFMGDRSRSVRESRDRETRDIEPLAAHDSIDGRLERAKDAALGPHDGEPSLADELGEATGGISGVLVGAGIGSAAGPIGALIGGIAGAIGGWWAGRAVAEAASTLTHEDEDYYR